MKGRDAGGSGAGDAVVSLDGVNNIINGWYGLKLQYTGQDRVIIGNNATRFASGIVNKLRHVSDATFTIQEDDHQLLLTAATTITATLTTGPIGREIIIMNPSAPLELVTVGGTSIYSVPVNRIIVLVFTGNLFGWRITSSRPFDGGAL